MTASREATAARPAEDHAAARAPWLAVAVLAGSQFLAVMSTTVVSVALPAIGTGLRASSAGMLWIVDAYVIVYSSLLVVGGSIGDRRGRKGVFLLGLVAFGVGSLAASFAPSVGWLLAARVLQGLGPVFLVPGSLTIIRALFEDERRRAQAIGLWSTGSGLGMAVGPVIGGLITAHLGWRWVFGFNVPVAAVLLLAAARAVPRLPRAPVTRRLDWPGAVLVTVGIAAVAFGMIEGNPLGWASPPVLAGFAISGCALAWFTARQLRLATPLVDIGLFRRAAFTAANVAAFTVFFAFIGAIVFLSAYFQQVRGESPVGAGLQVSVLGVAFAVTAPLSGRLVGRVGPRWPMLSGLVVAGLAMLGLLRLGLHTGPAAIWWDFALAGAGVGLCLTPMTQIAVSAVQASRAGMASAVHNSLRQFGQVLGVSVLGALVYARASQAGRLDDAQAASFTAGLHAAMWVSGLALLATAVLAGTLLRSRAYLPAAFAPLAEVRALDSERGVLAMPRVHPGRVGQPVEQPLGHVGEQRGEVLWCGCLAHAAGEQRVSGEHVRLAGKLAVGIVQDRDAAGSVPAQVDDGHRAVAEPQRLAVLHPAADGQRQLVRVGRVRDDLCAGMLLHLGQRLPMVPVPVGRHDRPDRHLADHLDQPIRLVGRVDQQALAAARAAQQVGVVVHGAHGYLGHGQAVDLTSVGRAADTHVSCISHLENPNTERPRVLRPRRQEGSREDTRPGRPARAGAAALRRVRRGIGVTTHPL
jgi:MFS transporter, DHA2 family, methylenomycin A resistance protein